MAGDTTVAPKNTARRRPAKGRPRIGHGLQARRLTEVPSVILLANGSVFVAFWCYELNVSIIRWFKFDIGL